MRTFIGCILAIVALTAMFFTGYLYPVDPPEPQVLTVTKIERVVQRVPYEVLKIYEVRKPFEVPIVLRDFEDEEELQEWLQKYKPLISISLGGGCVSFARHMVGLARADGYEVYFQAMSFNPSTGEVTKEHAVCSTIIGKKIYFIEPSTYEYWYIGRY